MRASAQKTATKTPRLRRKLFKEAELPPEAQELRRKFREWDESFESRAKRMAYVRRLCKRIAEAYQPEKIILFGSHAYGTPTPESDVDLLVVMDYEEPPLGQSFKMKVELGLVTPLDLLVRTPKEVLWRLEDGDIFMLDIFCRGKVMYESKHR